MRNVTSKVFSAAPRVFAMLICSAVMLESASCTLFSGVRVANESGRYLTVDIESDPGVAIEVRRGELVFWKDSWIPLDRYHPDAESGSPAPVHFPNRSELSFSANSPFEVRLVLKDDAADFSREYTIRNPWYGNKQFIIDEDLNLSPE